MFELEIEEFERNLAENDSCKEEVRSADDPGNLGEEVSDILTALEADKEMTILRKKDLSLLKK